jgi:hypothetical protein
MIKIFAFLALFVSFKAVGQELNEEYGSPVIVLTETSHLLKLTGSDVPSFVLYEKGQIIYKQMIRDSVVFRQMKLTQVETQNFILDLGIQEAIFKLPAFIGHTKSAEADQPVNELILNFDSLKIIKVMGALREKTAKARARTPKSFIDLYDKLINYDNSAALPWLPDKIELVVWGYDNATKSKPWPKQWPDLHSPTTVKLNRGMYSIYLGSNYFSDFKKYYNSIEAKQAVEIDGNKMAITYRLPFPNIR